MGTKQYLIECDFELHKEFVQNNIRNLLGSDDPDVVLISEDGREAATTKIFLSLFTPIFTNICSDPRQKTANINVPFPYETLTLLLQFLSTGSVASQEEDQLNLLMEMMNCLKIKTGDFNINQMFPRAATNPKPGLEEFVFEEDEFEEFYSTPRMKPSKKRNGMRREMVQIKTEPDIVFNAEIAELDFPFKKSAKEEKRNDDIIEDNLGEEENSNECKICKKLFKDRNRLKQHRVTHTKEKSYECSECGKKFGTPGILYNHSFVHNPPHHCELCTFKFAQKSGLQNHMKKSHGTS